MRAGTISELWRYPVKSMGGERIEVSAVAENGLPGDRGWVVRDETNGRFCNAKRFPSLFDFVATYSSEPSMGTPSNIQLPGGGTISSDDPAAAEKLSELLGRKVSLQSLRPADDLDFYRNVPRDPGVDQLADSRAKLGLEPDEPFPDLSSVPQVRQSFQSPPGTFFDAYPLLLITSAALRSFDAAVSGCADDVRRFRANLVVDTGEAEGCPEFEWAGKRLRVGDVELEAVAPAVRCAMVTHPQPGIERNTDLMRYLVRNTGQNAGLYLRVMTPGQVRVGDAVEVL